MRRTTARALEAIAAIVVYAGLAFGLQYPLFADPAHTVVDGGGWLTTPGVNLAMWVLAWDWHALTTAPWRLFDANMFHPAPYALTSAEPMLGQLPVFGPLYGLSGNPVLANQMNILFNVALSGAAMYALLRHWSAPRAAAFFAGFVYAFCPVRASSVFHVNLLAGQYLPLALLFLDRTLVTGTIRAAAGFGVFLLLQLLCSYELASMTLFVLAGYVLAILVVTRGWLSGRGLLLAVAAGAAAAGMLVVVSLPYVRARALGVVGDPGSLESLELGASHLWKNYLYPPVALRDWGWRLDRGLSLYVGLLPLACAVAALAPRRRAAAPVASPGPAPGAPCAGGEPCAQVAERGPVPPAARWATAAAFGATLVCYVMALGPEIRAGGWTLPSPYTAAMQFIPGFASVKAPSRFGLVLMVGFSALAGLGLARLLSLWSAAKMRRPLALAASIVAGISVSAGTACEYDLVRRRYQVREVAVGADLPMVYRVLAASPPGPVVEIPMGRCDLWDPTVESGYALYSTFHWQRLLNGYGNPSPRSYPAVRALAGALPDPRATELLARTTGLRHVIVHLTDVPLLERGRWFAPAGLRLIGAFGSDLLYDVEAAPPADLLLALGDFGQRQATVLGTPLDPLPDAARRAGLALAGPLLATPTVNLPFEAEVAVTNRSTVPWPALAIGSHGIVTLAYRWEDERGAVRDERRAAARLPYDLAPGESLLATMCVVAPPEPGSWRLVIGLVQDGRWFPDVLEMTQETVLPGGRT